MTLVVTEVSEKFGCVLAGDTAVTIGRTRVLLCAEKVQYSSEANIGFSVWGNACLAGRRVDELIASFVSQLKPTETPRSAGKQLALLLTCEGTNDGRGWDVLRGGVHICGYEGFVPVLFHVHTGHTPPAPQGPFQLYEDFQDGRKGVQLRNGYFETFGHLFDAMQQYAARLQSSGYKWPFETIEDRVSYYSIMINTVAQTLMAAGRLPAVGPSVSAFAFNQNGIQVDKRLPRGSADFCSKGSCEGMASFCG